MNKFIRNTLVYLKNNLLLLLSVAIIVFTLKPSLTLPINADTYTEFAIATKDFGKNSTNFKIFNVTPLYYFSPYGTLELSNAITLKLFSFNSSYYTFLTMIVRILAAVSIYYFAAKWSGYKLTGFISSLYFGICYPGFENTFRTSLYIIYPAVFFMFLFFDKWFTFHNKPNIKNLKKSLIFLVLSILIYPARMVGMIIVISAGEIYRMLEKFKERKTLKLRFKHILYTFITLAIMILISGTLKKTDELQFKMISVFALFKSVITGSYPSIFSLWLFISNLIFSPQFFMSKLISYPVLNNISVLLPISALVTFFVLLFKKKYSLALITTTAIAFPFLVNISVPYLTNWNRDWVMAVKYGGTIFMLFLIILLYMWEKSRKLAEVGWLGVIILTSNIFFAWMLAPVYFIDSQSSFDFAIRYYTLPSAGMGLLFGSVFSYLFYSLITFIKNVLSINKKKILSFSKLLLSIPVYLVPMLIILYSVTLNGVTTNSIFIEKNKGLDSKKIDGLWKVLVLSNISFKNNKSSKIIYLDNFGTSQEKDYVKTIFPIRFSLTAGDVVNPPQYFFIYDKETLNRIYSEVPNKNTKIDFYAFRFEDSKLYDIKNNFSINLSK